MTPCWKGHTTSYSLVSSICESRVPSDTNYGLASVYRAQAAFNGVMDLNVLRDAQQAVEWLGIDSAMLTQILPPDFH